MAWHACGMQHLVSMCAAGVYAGSFQAFHRFSCFMLALPDLLTLVLPFQVGIASSSGYPNHEPVSGISSLMSDNTLVRGYSPK